MPYNNTPITPSKEVTGHVSLPLARVQKIISADPDRLATSKNASFAIALATEMFIQHLATTTHNVVKAERKPRRNIQYRDVSSAVAKTDNLEFLVDVVPRTVTYREFKKRVKDKETGEAKEKEAQKDIRKELQKGENGVEKEKEKEEEEEKSKAVVSEVIAEEQVQVDDATDAMDIEEVERVEDSDSEQANAAKQVQMQIEMEMRGPPQASASPPPPPPPPPAQQQQQQQQLPPPRMSGGFTAINGRGL